MRNPADDCDPRPLRSVVDDPRPGDVLRGPRRDGRVITINVLRRKPRLLVADGQFTFVLALPEFRKWAATAEVITRAGGK